jgi:CRP-like cAMP-binding protein
MGTGERERQDVPWSSSLTKRAARQLARRIDWVDLPDGEVIAERGHSARWVYVVGDGRVRRIGGHRDAVLAAGSLIGAAEALHRAAYRDRYVAAGPVRLATIGRREFLAALETVPGLATVVLRTLTEPMVTPRLRPALHHHRRTPSPVLAARGAA